LQVALRVGGGRLRLAEAGGEARREDEALVRHLEDLVAGLRVPEQAPLELEEDDVERRQELGVRQLRERLLEAELFVIHDVQSPRRGLACPAPATVPPRAGRRPPGCRGRASAAPSRGPARRRAPP